MAYEAIPRVFCSAVVDREGLTTPMTSARTLPHLRRRNALLARPSEAP